MTKLEQLCEQQTELSQALNLLSNAAHYIQGVTYGYIKPDDPRLEHWINDYLKVFGESKE